MARSKWGRGGLHHPPSSEGSARVVRRAEVGGWFSHLISKHAPQLCPSLNSAVALAVQVAVPASPACNGSAGSSVSSSFHPFETLKR
jgi:hypothetical protein